MGARIRLLRFYWLDEEGKSKENKIKKCANPPKYFGYALKKIKKFISFLPSLLYWL
jgi:hypothetical protein